jgi:hypothetical protein
MASAQIEESASKRKVKRSAQGRLFDAVARPPVTVQWKPQRLGSGICLGIAWLLTLRFQSHHYVTEVYFSIAAQLVLARLRGERLCKLLEAARNSYARFSRIDVSYCVSMYNQIFI